MSAIIKACQVRNSVKNTGKECDTSMVATAMLICVPRSLKITDENLQDPIPFFNGLIHGVGGKQIYPLFGINAPITGINNSSESDIIVTLDNGLQVFLRYGVYNRSYETTSGGLCYAAALASFLKSGYAVIEIDQQGQMMMRKNTDGTYGGLIMDFMYSPSPILPDFKTTPYKNRFQLSFSPLEMVNNGVIFQGGEQLLSIMGLIDTEILPGTQTQTTTKLYVKVQTECAGEDLVALFPTKINDADLFVIRNKTTGNEIIPSGVAVSEGEVEFTGVFPAGSYTVTGTPPVDWYDSGNGIEGYDASQSTATLVVAP